MGIGFRFKMKRVLRMRLFGNKTDRKLSKKQTKANLGFENLEDRRLMAGSVELDGGTLRIEGTSANDTVQVQYYQNDSNYILVMRTHSGHTHTRYFRTSDVDLVQFSGKDGNDYFRNDTSIRSYANGGNGNDTLIGGSNRDMLAGDAGNDQLWARGGNDSVYGASGNDYMRGGSGNDLMFGASGNDTVYGESGNDTLYGGYGDDYLVGGSQNDNMFGGSGNDIMWGEGGADNMYGDAGYDTMYGGIGNDFMRGWRRSRRECMLSGGAGGDKLYGQDGDDILDGGSGNDALRGGKGSDFLSGGSGNDYLDGGNGSYDIIYGGSGSDTFVRHSHRSYWLNDNDKFMDFSKGDGDRTKTIYYW